MNRSVRWLPTLPFLLVALAALSCGAAWPALDGNGTEHETPAHMLTGQGALEGAVDTMDCGIATKDNPRWPSNIACR